VGRGADAKERDLGSKERRVFAERERERGKIVIRWGLCDEKNARGFVSS